jgi:autotransporter-associated beta strand protein
MIRNMVAIVILFALSIGTFSAQGTTNYWDNNGDTAGFGTAGGIWGTEAKWSADSTGASLPAVTDTTASDDLVFGTADNGLVSGTITVNGVNQAFRSMTFGAASGAITCSNGTLTLAAPASTITVNNTSNTLASVLAGSNGLGIYEATALTYTNFLTASSTILFTNANLASFVRVAAIMSGNAISFTNTPAAPYYFSNNGSTATMQMQAYNGGYTKCVKIELTQSGSDIAGRALYAKYHSSGANVIGFDFDTGGTGNSIATSYTAGGYGISLLSLAATHILTLSGVNTYSGDTAIGSGTLEIGGNGQLGSGLYSGAITNSGALVYSSSADQHLRGVLSGSGSLVKDCFVKVPALVSYTNFLPQTPTLVTVVPNAQLSECVGADGLLGGASIGSGNQSRPADAYFFTNLGSSVTYQLQAIDGAWLKCVKVELVQSGVNIAARSLYAKYLPNSNPLGYNFDTNGNSVGVATSYTSGGYGAAETYLTISRYSRLTLSGTNTYSGGTVVNRGVLEAVTNASALPSTGGITVNSGGELVLRVGSQNNGSNGGVGNGNPITVNSGGILTLAAVFNAGNTRAITINGGTINSIVTEDSSDNGNYMNNLTLRNGAQVIGYRPRMGFTSPPFLTVSGTSASSIAAGLNLVRQSSEVLTLNVADVTGNADTDLSISGIIRDFPGLTGLPIIKTGTGTVSISGINTHIGPITVMAGTFALATNGTLNTGNPITLSGGTLAMGAFTNTVGTLAVVSNSVITLGSGRLAFADSSAVGWTNTLTLTGALDAQTLRFGTNTAALTSAQLSAINLNGKRVRIRIDGYLAPTLKGTLICVQ